MPLKIKPPPPPPSYDHIMNDEMGYFLFVSKLNDLLPSIIFKKGFGFFVLR